MLHTENVARGQTESFQNVGGAGESAYDVCINFLKVGGQEEVVSNWFGLITYAQCTPPRDI